MKHLFFILLFLPSMGVAMGIEAAELSSTASSYDESQLRPSTTGGTTHLC